MLIDSRILKHAIATVMPSRTEVFLIIDGMPDAIVRCKDCKHGEQCNQNLGEFYFCTHDIGTTETSVHKPDWFCADGERKEE